MSELEGEKVRRWVGVQNQGKQTKDGLHLSLAACRRESATACRLPLAARRRGGFSLVELMVVLVLLALLAGVSAPAIGRYFDNLEYRRQAGGIAAVVRYARLMAVTRGKPVRLALAGEGAPALLLTGAVEEQRPAGTGEDDRLIIEPDEIVFYPGGRATPGRITFSRGERRRTILVDPLTGMPVWEL